jgi:lysine-specific demethylase 8
MTMSDFITNHIENPNQEETGYLAQTQLFEQIPDLKKDIIIPDYCNLGDFDEPIVNAWFGPKGTVSSLHHDRYHNLLSQVVGEKYIRIYHPNQSNLLYPNSSNKLLFNTSQVDVESPNLEEFPSFSKASYVECILKENEMLYIPPFFWHYVRSLATSFSVSFWWQ